MNPGADAWAAMALPVTRVPVTSGTQPKACIAAILRTAIATCSRKLPQPSTLQYAPLQETSA